MDDNASGITGRSRALLTRLSARGREFVSVDDAASKLDLGRREAAKLLARWAEQGWLRRVRRGLYIAVPINAEHPDQWSADPLVVATMVWSPCYFTGWTGANYWGLTEQVFQTIVVKTAARVRSRNQTVLDQKYLVGTVPAKDLEWGVRPVWLSGTKVSMADETRVVIDVLDDPGIGGGIRHCSDILTAYWAEHDRALLLTYADRLGNGAVVKRLGYLSEHLGLADETFLAACERRLSAGVASLDPSARASGARNSRWRVRVNVSAERVEPS